MRYRAANSSLTGYLANFTHKDYTHEEKEKSPQEQPQAMDLSDMVSIHHPIAHPPALLDDFLL
jgi:hypothetical protein